MAERLAALGMPIDPAEVFALVREGSAGRPHVAQVMVRRGYVKSVREAFDRYLGAGKPGHVPRKKLSPEDAVRLLRRAGGVPVLAHPGLAARDELVPALVEAGLMGIECYYNEHSAAQTGGYLQMCRDRGLVATGGSDFHGPTVRAARLGTPRVPLAAWAGGWVQVVWLRHIHPAAPPLLALVPAAYTALAALDGVHGVQVERGTAWVDHDGRLGAEQCAAALPLRWVDAEDGQLQLG